MSEASDLVVVDTGVFSAGLGADKENLATLYAADIQGKKLAISFQTEAEIRYGAVSAGWGPKRMLALEDRLVMAVVVPAHEDLTSAYVALRNDCRKAGHGLHYPSQTADLWIAATALSLSAPLITHDAIFVGTPGISVICRVQANDIT